MKGERPETVRHQAERLWKDPKAEKARKKLAKKVGDKVGHLTK